MNKLIEKWESIARPRAGPQDLDHTLAGAMAREIVADLIAERDRTEAELQRLKGVLMTDREIATVNACRRIVRGEE